uniref:Ig-like domain-containing protein n=1 Tax=Hucho hucho TaxID=62062 RepID=A0A4W5N7U2_9TELE
MVEKEGDMVTLSCSAHGHPAPQFTWTPSGKESVAVKGNKVVSMVMLEASAAVLKDGVTCEASNNHGAASQAFKVTIKQAVDPNAANDAGRGRHLSVFSLLFSPLLSGLCVVYSL